MIQKYSCFWHIKTARCLLIILIVLVIVIWVSSIYHSSILDHLEYFHMCKLQLFGVSAKRPEICEAPHIELQRNGPGNARRCPTIKWPKKLPHSNLMCPNHRYVLTLPKLIWFCLQLTQCSGYPNSMQRHWTCNLFAITVHTTATGCCLDVFGSSWLSRFGTAYESRGVLCCDSTAWPPWPAWTKDFCSLSIFGKEAAATLATLVLATFTIGFPINGGKTLGKNRWYPWKRRAP